MDKVDYELMVSPGRQPIYFLVLAGVFYTAMLFFIYDAVSAFYQFGFSDDSARFAARRSEIIVLCFVMGLRFSMTKDVLIDVDTNLLISKYSVGPLSRSIRSKCPDLEYISVFRNAKEMFEVNLWYKGNRHYKMYEFEDSESAFTFARAASTKLKIDLLDATEKGNSKWL